MARRIFAVLMIFILLAVSYDIAFAYVDEDSDTIPYVESESAILLEITTGNVLYEKNADKIMYPASITKTLTALVMLDYIDIDEIIVTGVEIHDVPWDASRAGHLVNEHISALNLIRALMLPSGNDTAVTVALNVARRHSGNNNISYLEAETVFSELMNIKAQDLGAENSNFTNPHGYHHENHYSTARDLALISIEALNNEILASVIRESRFEGLGAELEDEGLRVNEYLWNNTNSLISSTAHFYQDAIGIKTGFTTPAGFCLASAAKRNGVKLVSVVLGAENSSIRYEDSISMLNYGFDNFEFLEVQHMSEILDEITLNNPPLGFLKTITVSAQNEFIDYLSQEQFEKITKEINYNPSLYEISEDDFATKLFLLPIEKGQIVGEITYSLDGVVIFTDNILADFDVFERTIFTDIDFYYNFLRANAFTVPALPYWAGIVGIIIFIINIIIKVRRRKKRKKSQSYTFNGKRRW